MKAYLIDSSVWIDVLTDRPGAAQDRFVELAAEPDQIVTTEPVLMELRAGANGLRRLRIESVLNRLRLRGIDPAIDFHYAADLYRNVRISGHTVRSMVDCLIASVAVRTEAILVHRDRDFERIAAVASDLRSESLLT
ncbi:hypothetical protein FHR81_004249 [Actinoalloteichus hoggarensis]|uniref:Ribonuclease VapC n=1 Tax=Actinoalloteichus hoggarensis TaxID=1470176 RepID=A0A221W9I2_9PSEU|nr:PIN domain nuclease [Actinoalloteichus hoggarensis]ASO22394.1 Ribonuclease VapC11 [Actinoalloteichus hoggarensis]MBB5923182.1 hypothetical protein [Actinoalloteichus hoggarensis]